jgi:hypothetical protein
MGMFLVLRLRLRLGLGFFGLVLDMNLLASDSPNH